MTRDQPPIGREAIWNPARRECGYGRRKEIRCERLPAGEHHRDVLEGLARFVEHALEEREIEIRDARLARPAGAVEVAEIRELEADRESA
jgi:hypothetical protein